MKKTILSIKALLASGLMLVGVVGNAQNYAFPYNADYPFGYKPTTVDGAHAQAAYNSWKTGYLTDGPSCANTNGATKRVKFDAVSKRFPSITGDNSIATVSEGIAYGMLMTAYAGEKANFDGLWAYYKKFDTDGNGIMDWGVNNTACTIVGQNGATDAELDVAWALYVASWQFDGGSQSSTYLAGAKTLIAAIKKNEVEASTNILKPGDKFGGSGAGNNDLVNISYFSPAYYRVFGEITNDVAFWDAVYKKGYDVMESAMNKTTGLVPDWCKSDGTTPAAGATQYDDGGVNFFYDGVRTPIRVALDYIWYGDQSPRALSYTTKINNWLRGKHPNPVDIGAKYTLSGEKKDLSHNNTFVGAFAVSAMATSDANTRSYITSIYNENVKVNPGSGEYFNSSWKALSLFILTGNFYLPPPDLCEGPYVEPEYNLCSSTATTKSVTIDCYIDGASKYEWKKLGTTAVLGSARTFTTTQAGIYEITTTFNIGGKPCIRRAATVVNPATPTASFTYTRSGLAIDFKNTSVGGDLIGGSLTSSWAFGTGATPATSTVTDGATNYSSGGSKLVTLTVKNTCNVSNSFTETIPLLQGSGPGWMATDFTSDSPGLLASFLSPNVPNPNITITKNCQFGRGEVKVGNAQDKTLAITFKKGANNAPINVTAYPYARFRIRINATTYPFVTANGLRVDLVDTSFVGSGGAASGNSVVYLKGPRNADGSYQTIPLNTWFVSTLSFEDAIAKYPAFKENVVLQLAFYPYNDFPTATGRVPYSIDIDWAQVGNDTTFKKPNPTIESGVTPVCITNPVYDFLGSSLDSCNAEKVLWSDGVTTFSRKMIPGTYSATVTNFAGSETRTFTVAAIDTIQPNLTYSIVSTSPLQIQPIDDSKGDISAYRWHRVNSLSTTLNTTFSQNSSTNTMLYSASTKTPPVSPLATTTTTGYQRIFTGTGTEYLCLNATSRVPNCTWHGTSSIAKKCIQVFPSGPLALEETSTETSFAIFPTVVTDNRLNVQLGTSLQGAYEVQVMNSSGKQVASSKAISGKNEITLDSNLPAGTYIVKVSQGDKTFTERFIKQ